MVLLEGAGKKELAGWSVRKILFRASNFRALLDQPPCSLHHRQLSALNSFGLVLSSPNAYMSYTVSSSLIFKSEFHIFNIFSTVALPSRRFFTRRGETC